MKKFVWDTSAIMNIKEPNSEGYSPAHSLFKDLADGWITGDYLNIFPTLAVFEASAAVSRKIREGAPVLREFYLLDSHSVLYDVDQTLISKCVDLFAKPGFTNLRGADLVFACIAQVEGACLVTLDNGFSKWISEYVDVLDLNDCREAPNYRSRFETKP